MGKPFFGRKSQDKQWGGVYGTDDYIWYLKSINFIFLVIQGVNSRCPQNNLFRPNDFFFKFNIAASVICCKCPYTISFVSIPARSYHTKIILFLTIGRIFKCQVKIAIERTMIKQSVSTIIDHYWLGMK